MKTFRAMRSKSPAARRWLALGIWLVEAMVILASMLIVLVKREFQEVPVSALPE